MRLFYLLLLVVLIGSVTGCSITGHLPDNPPDEIGVNDPNLLHHK